MRRLQTAACLLLAWLGSSAPAAAIDCPIAGDAWKFLGDLNYPDGTPVPEGTTINKGWKLQNCGTTNWSGFKAVRIGGIYGPSEFALPNAPSLQVFDIFQTMTVPSIPPHTPGLYRAEYKVRTSSGVLLAESFWVEVFVTGGTAQFTLSVTKSGSGSVTSSPGGINCGGQCSAAFGAGTTVSLDPDPAPGWEFAGWSGDGDCSDGQVVMTGNRSCHATFQPVPPGQFVLTVSTSGSGGGNVTGPGIRCGSGGSDCSQAFNSGATVTLGATPLPGSTFGGWGGDCNSAGQVVMNGNRHCTASFNVGAPDYCAQFIADVTIPDGTELPQGESGTKRWRLKNCGTQSWAGVVAVRVPGSTGPPYFPDSFDVPDLPSNLEGEVPMDFTAPPTLGQHKVTYRLQHNGAPFPDPFWIDITVVPADYCARFVRHLDDFFQPRATRPNEGFTKRWLVENCGNVTWTSLFGAAKLEGFGPDLLSVPALAKGQQGIVEAVVMPDQIPAQTGIANAHYRMRRPSGEGFGDALSHAIVVSSFPSTDARRDQLVAKLNQLRNESKEAALADLEAFAELQSRFFELVTVEPDARTAVQTVYAVAAEFIPGQQVYGTAKTLLNIIEWVGRSSVAKTLVGLSLETFELVPTGASWEQIRDDLVRPANMAETTAPLLQALDAKFDQTIPQIPDPLPANYPFDDVMNLLEWQIQEIRASRQGETWVDICYLTLSSPTPFVCSQVKLGVLQDQRDTMEATTNLIGWADEVSWYAVVWQIAVNGTAVTIKVAGLITGPGDIPLEAVWVPAFWLSLPGAAVDGLASVGSLTGTGAMLGVSLLAHGQFINEAELRKELFDTTLDLVVGLAANANLQAGAALAAPSGSAVSAEVEATDVVVGATSGAGQGYADVTLVNQGTNPVSAGINGTLTTWRNGRPLTVNLTGRAPETIPAQSSHVIRIPYQVVRSSFLGGTGYDLHLGLSTVDSAGHFERKLLPVRHFFAGTAAQLPVLRNQAFSTIGGGSLAPGAVFEAPIQFAAGTQTGRILLSFLEGGDLDLHLVDAAGRHVGIDYGNGQAEVEIPGVVYRGGAGVWPESIQIANPTGTYTVRVVSRDPDTTQTYDLSLLLTPPLPGILDAAPEVEQLANHPPGATTTASIAVMIAEGGGSQGLTGLQASLSDLAGDLGDVLPAAGFSVAVPPTLSAGTRGLVRLTTTLGPATLNGVYVGTLTVAGQDGAGRALSVTSRISLIVTFNNHVPVAAAGGPYTVNEGSVLLVDGSHSTDPEGSALRYRWDFDGGGWDTAFSTDSTASHTWADDQTATIVLQVLDDHRLTDRDEAVVEVRNVAPVVNAGPDVVVILGSAFNGSGSFFDPGTADTHSILWDFGDGTTAVGTLTPVHVYAAFGTYPVTLTVTDDDGGVGTDSLTVVVNAPPVAANDVYRADGSLTLRVPAPGVLGNDTDPEHDPLHVALVSGPARGRLTLHDDGSFSYKRDSGFCGVDSFTYQAHDGLSPSNVATVTVRPPLDCEDLYAIDPQEDALLRIDVATAHTVVVGGLGMDVLSAGADFSSDGKLWAVSALGTGDLVLYLVDLSTGAATVKHTLDLPGAGAVGLEFGPDGETAYLATGGSWFKLNVQTGAAEPFTDLPFPTGDFTLPGRCRDFFAPDLATGRLVRVASFDGAASEVGLPQVEAVDALAAAPDGPLYAHARGQLYTLDSATALATPVGPLGYSASALAFRPPLNKDRCLDQGFNPSTRLSQAVVRVNGKVKHVSRCDLAQGGVGDMDGPDCGRCGAPGFYRLPKGAELVFETSSLPVAGQYTLELRAKADDDDDDDDDGNDGDDDDDDDEATLRIAIGEGSGAPAHTVEVESSSWTWTKALVVTLGNGVNRIRVRSLRGTVDVENARVRRRCPGPCAGDKVKACLDRHYRPADGLSDHVIVVEGTAGHKNGGGSCGRSGFYYVSGFDGRLGARVEVPASGRFLFRFHHRLRAAQPATRLRVLVGGRSFELGPEQLNDSAKFGWSDSLEVGLEAGPREIEFLSLGGGEIDIEQVSLELVCECGAAGT